MSNRAIDPPNPSRAAIRVRPVQSTDLELLVDHRVRMWRDIGGYSESLLRGHAAVYRRWLRPKLADRTIVGFVAMVGRDSVAGSGCLWVQEAQPRPGMPQTLTPYILSMYTAPEHRGRGVASSIVRALIRYCRFRGFPRVTLHASPQGRSVYAAIGFERTWEMRRWLDPAAIRRERRRRTSSPVSPAGSAAG